MSVTIGNLVRLLLDTQILIWMVSGDKKLTPAFLAALQNPDATLHVSAVTAYEYADLQNRKRIPVDEPLAELIDRFDLSIEPFPANCWQAAALLPDIHRDPVDRMLIAHALSAEMTLVTADTLMRQYPVALI